MYLKYCPRQYSNTEPFPLALVVRLFRRPDLYQYGPVGRLLNNACVVQKRRDRVKHWPSLEGLSKLYCI